LTAILAVALSGYLSKSILMLNQFAGWHYPV
jgi:hypothetical protein